MGALPSCVGADAFVRPAEQSDAWGMRKAPRPREGVHRVADLIARLARNLGRMRPGCTGSRLAFIHFTQARSKHSSLAWVHFRLV